MLVVFLCSLLIHGLLGSKSDQYVRMKMVTRPWCVVPCDTATYGRSSRQVALCELPSRA
jgi:hypothetical protein